MASLEALVGDAPAVTFNAAGLNSQTAAKYGVNVDDPNQIKAYVVNEDPLNVGQDNTPLPSALGRRYPLAADNPVSINSNGLAVGSPMNGAQVVLNFADANLHFMGAVESSIYTNFEVFILVAH